MSKKKIRIIPWKLLSLTGIVLVIGIAIGSHFSSHASTQYADSSLTDEEIIENQQTTVPPDVLAEMNKTQDVLGAATTDSPLKPTTFKVPILIYHYVEYVQDAGDKTRISLNTTPYTLEQEILTLKNAGYTFMTNQELTEVLNGKTKLPSKPIVLTFDDGYRDFYTDAYPILKKYHVKATQYVIAGFLDNPNHLTTSQLQEIAKDGLVEIGAHTVHHIWLKGQSSSVVTYEVQESKKILEGLIHKQVTSFAYPFGAFDMQAINAVKAAGFTSATATVTGINQSQINKYFLYRIHPGGTIGQDLLNMLMSVQ